METESGGEGVVALSGGEGQSEAKGNLACKFAGKASQ